MNIEFEKLQEVCKYSNVYSCEKLQHGNACIESNCPMKEEKVYEWTYYEELDSLTGEKHWYYTLECCDDKIADFNYEECEYTHCPFCGGKIIER